MSAATTPAPAPVSEADAELALVLAFLDAEVLELRRWALDQSKPPRERALLGWHAAAIALRASRLQAHVHRVPR